MMETAYPTSYSVRLDTEQFSCGWCALLTKARSDTRALLTIGGDAKAWSGAKEENAEHSSRPT